MRHLGALAALIIGLYACTPKQADPFGPMALALEQADAPLPDGWRPHAVLVVGYPVVQTALTMALTEQFAQRGEPVPLKVPPDLVLRMSPRPELRSAALTASDACESCLLWSVDTGGTALVQLSNASGDTQREVAWEGTIHAVLQARVEPHPRGGRRVVVQPADADGWDVRITSLGELGGGWLSLLSSSLSDPIRHVVTHQQIPAVPVARFAGDGPVPIRGLRLRGSEAGLVVDLAFVIPAVEGAVGDPALERDWAAAVSTGAVLSMMRAAALDAPAEQGFRMFPAGFDVADDRFRLDVMMVPETRGKVREMTVRGSVSLIESQLVVTPDAVDLPPGTPFAALIERVILAKMRQSMETSVPAAEAVPMGTSSLQVTATGLGAVDGVVTVHGTAEVSEP